MNRPLRFLFSALIASLAVTASAQGRKDSVVLGMVLEPAPGLDPTMASAAAIGEVVHMSVLEGLTKIGMDGSVSPLLAESWTVDPDGKVRGVDALYVADASIMPADCRANTHLTTVMIGENIADRLRRR